MKSRPSLGLGLLYLGLFFGLLSILFFFNRPLIVISNLLIAMGFLFLLGSSKFFLFFRKKFKGSVLYLVGFVFLMFKYDSYSLLKEMSPQFFGLFVQMVGCYFLFEEFLPHSYKTPLPPPGSMNRKDSKRKSHQECPVKTGGRGRPRQARRHKTCPSPREISKVMASMALGMLNEGGCSEDELLEKCIQSFDSAGSLRRGDHVLNMVLAMHSWVLPSAHFAARLLTLYQEATGSTQELRRLQICHLVRYWLTQHPETMHQDPQLEEVIGRFWATVEQEGNSVQQSLGDFSSRLSPGGPGPPHPMSSPGLGKKRKVSLLFDHLETGELAEHLTYLEFRSFQAITPQDLRDYVLQGSVRGCPTLEGSVGLSNSVSRWVQVMVLSRPGPAQRAQVLDKFIQVAQKLLQLHNFNTLMAVTGGLCHSAISRLKDSHAHLSPDSTKALLELTELLAAHNNYARYRRTWAGCMDFRLPVLGVHLKDLVALNEAQPDRLPDGRLHLPKLNSLYLRLQELAALQQQHPPGNASEDLLHLLTLSLDLFYTEDEIYELSYAREPRCPKSLPPSPFKAPLVVEWAPGVTPKPDTVTLGRHVEQLVESVFKNYDPDGRGTISQEDFERLSGNFPFACHGLHPPPCQGSGSFSREELTGYLLRASAICSKLGLAFLHTFQEVTFRKPTFCNSCSGFVSILPAITLRDPSWSTLTLHSLGWESQPFPVALTIPKPQIMPIFRKILQLK